MNFVCLLPLLFESMLAARWRAFLPPVKAVTCELGQTLQPQKKTSKQGSGVPPSRKSQLETRLREDMSQWRRWWLQRPCVKGEADQRGRCEIDLFIEVIKSITSMSDSSEQWSRGGYATFASFLRLTVSLVRWVSSTNPSLHSGLSA